jgi:hydrogenase/urease accessory protein HupE
VQALTYPAALVLMLVASPALAHNVPSEQRRALIEGGHLDYLWSGAVHMLTGYDHLLFLFGVMFFLTTFRSIVTFVTAFTLGHSVTLLGATLLGIKANHYLIDAVIAVSVIYKGFDNLDGFRRVIGIKPPNALAIVLGFGLIHGFGLASRLQQLQLPEQGLVTRILAFNVGVELGQIAALVVMAWVLGLAREDTKDFGPFTRAANGSLMSAGVLLLLFQLHGYLHATYPDDYGFSRDQHMHHHEDVERFNRDVGDALRPPR